MQSLLGEGDYSDPLMILPFAETPEGEFVPSFPGLLQGAAQGVRAAGRLAVWFLKVCRSILRRACRRKMFMTMCLRLA